MSPIMPKKQQLVWKGSGYTNYVKCCGAVAYENKEEAVCRRAQKTNEKCYKQAWNGYKHFRRAAAVKNESFIYNII